MSLTSLHKPTSLYGPLLPESIGHASSSRHTFGLILLGAIMGTNELLTASLSHMHWICEKDKHRAILIMSLYMDYDVRE